MRTVPTLDWTCSRCGGSEKLTLVKVDRDGVRHGDAPPPRRAVPTLDWTCSRCGASETLTLVKASAAA